MVVSGSLLGIIGLALSIWLFLRAYWAYLGMYCLYGCFWEHVGYMWVCIVFMVVSGSLLGIIGLVVSIQLSLGAYWAYLGLYCLDGWSYWAFLDFWLSAVRTSWCEWGHVILIVFPTAEAV